MVMNVRCLAYYLLKNGSKGLQVIDPRLGRGAHENDTASSQMIMYTWGPESNIYCNRQHYDVPIIVREVDVSNTQYDNGG